MKLILVPTQTTTTQITIQMTDLPNNGYGYSYRVAYTTLGQTETNADVVKNSSYHTKRGLTPGRTYHIKVWAYLGPNYQGFAQGDFSTDSSGGGNKPTYPTLSITLDHVENNRLRVKFDFSKLPGGKTLDIAYTIKPSVGYTNPTRKRITTNGYDVYWYYDNIPTGYTYTVSAEIIDTSNGATIPCKSDTKQIGSPKPDTVLKLESEYNSITANIQYLDLGHPNRKFDVYVKTPQGVWQKVITKSVTNNAYDSYDGYPSKSITFFYVDNGYPIFPRTSYSVKVIINDNWWESEKSIVTENFPVEPSLSLIASTSSSLSVNINNLSSYYSFWGYWSLNGQDQNLQSPTQSVWTDKQTYNQAGHTFLYKNLNYGTTYNIKVELFFQGTNNRRITSIVITDTFSTDSFTEDPILSKYSVDYYSIKVKLSNMNEQYTGTRTFYWYLNSPSPHGITSGTSSDQYYTFYNLNPNQNYSIKVIGTALGIPQFTKTISVSTNAININKWDWNQNEDRKKAYIAITKKGKVQDFSYLVWNDIVNKIKEIREFLNLDNQILNSCTLNNSNKILTAEIFNELNTALSNYSRPVSAVSPGDPVIGNYFILITNTINNWISGIKKGTYRPV